MHNDQNEQLDADGKTGHSPGTTNADTSATTRKAQSFEVVDSDQRHLSSVVEQRFRKPLGIEANTRGYEHIPAKAGLAANSCKNGSVCGRVNQSAPQELDAHPEAWPPNLDEALAYAEELKSQDGGTGAAQYGGSGPSLDEMYIALLASEVSRYRSLDRAREKADEAFARMSADYELLRARLGRFEALPAQLRAGIVPDRDSSTTQAIVEYVARMIEQTLRDEP